ncbi:MAG: flagellin lysine-N-methylase [Cellulosilyticaceae bacterium]
MTGKINLIQPAYYDTFECIGNACQNNCCHGWRITIDEKTYKKYKKIKHPDLVKPFKEGLKRIRNNTTQNAYGQFKLVDGKCPLLNEQGLCNIYIHVGSDYMCTTCKQFPRQYVKCGDSYTASMSLACEEVARLLFENEEPLAFKEVQESLDLNALAMSKIGIQSYFLELRSVYITILQNRHYSIQERLLILGMLCEQLDESDREDIPNVLGAFLDALEDMSLRGTLQEIQLREDLQHASYKQMMLYSIEQRKALGKIGVHVARALVGLALDDTYGVAEALVHQENRKFNGFLEKYSYVMEHYLVNLLVDGGVYFADSHLQTFYHLIIRYTYLKMFLAGYEEEEQTKALATELIVDIERNMGHSDIFKKSVEAILKSDTLTLENAMYLIMS